MPKPKRPPPRPVDSKSNPLTMLAFALLTGPKGTVRDLAADSFRVLAGTALESLGGAMKQQPHADSVPPDSG
ncbi:MAG: hypothetical protein WC998_09110, partial [Candidatus Paceibacterota bacterium]